MTSPSRAKTLLLDCLGGIVVIWSIPLAIVVVGAPFALVFMLLRWLVHSAL